MKIDEGELASLRAASQPLRFEPIDDAYSDSGTAADERPDSLLLLEQEEMRESVITAIAALPERLRLVIQLYLVEELNLSEIAQVLSVSIAPSAPAQVTSAHRIARGAGGCGRGGLITQPRL